MSNRLFKRMYILYFFASERCGPNNNFSDVCFLGGKNDSTHSTQLYSGI
jgi:hypothetical protein